MLKDPFTVDPTKWTPLHTKLIKRAASYPQVSRIFVHPAIKKVLCEQAGKDRTWLGKVRPWWGITTISTSGSNAHPGWPAARTRSRRAATTVAERSLRNWFVMLRKAEIAAAKPAAPGASPRRRSRNSPLATCLRNA